MNRAKWLSRSGVLIIALALVVVTNPEARALLLLADAVGLEVLALMAFVQAGSTWPIIAAATQVLASALCPFTSSASRCAARLVVGLVWSRQSLAQPLHAACAYLRAPCSLRSWSSA